ncbi:MAG: leucine-rich repeat domain-containing protein [Eubacteriales bacterium]|nr:leucine-rich repeat domain-containing protein [Eubacteriales bacterium]
MKKTSGAKYSLFIAALLLSLVFAVGAQADTEGSFTYTVTDGQATVTGCSIKSGQVEIPAVLGGYPVTAIGQSAFRSNSGITSVTIPSSVTSIGLHAFYACEGLESVDIPSSVRYIHEGAFIYCSSLNSVVIPSGVTTINTDTFAGCSSLSNVTIPSSVTSIGDSAFSLCRSLTSITIPDSVTTIGSNAFNGNRNLTSVTLPDSLKIIRYHAFLHCGLTSVTIPGSVTNIGDNAFYRCENMTSATFEGTAEPEHGTGVFGNTNVTSVNVPTGYTGDTFCDVPVKRPNGVVQPTYEIKVDGKNGTVSRTNETSKVYDDMYVRFSVGYDLGGTAYAVVACVDVDWEEGLEGAAGSFTVPRIQGAGTCTGESYIVTTNANADELTVVAAMKDSFGVLIR